MADPDKVFDIEVADRMSQGCGRHNDPACLCDVDVSKTADIEWKRGPVEFLGVTSSEELAQRWADWVYQNEIESQVKPIRTIEDAPRKVGAPNVGGWQRPFYFPAISDVEEVVTRLRAGESATTVAKTTGNSRESVQDLGTVLAATRPGQPAPKWALYAINRYADGVRPYQIADEIGELWGERPHHRRVAQYIGRQRSRGVA